MVVMVAISTMTVMVAMATMVVLAAHPVGTADCALAYVTCSDCLR
jgi:hypothetical protein